MSIRLSTRAVSTVSDRLKRDRSVRPLTLYGAVAAAVTLVVAAAPWLWARGDAPARPQTGFDWLVGNWLWWDGGWYLQIAQHGYSYHPHQQSSVAFFPIYPMTVKAVGALLPGGLALAAVLITIVSGALVFVLFQRWCRRHLSTVESSWALVALAVYPYAWFLYGAAYADALFLAATLLAFLLLEQDRPIAAGLAAAVATAARPTGVVVIIGLVAVLLERRGVFDRVGRRVRPREFGVLLGVLGILAWCAYLAVRFGNALAFIETEGAKGWDRAPGLSTWLKFDFFSSIFHDAPHKWLPLVAQAILCGAFALAIPAVWRRFGRGYGIYVAAAVALPALSTGEFMGTGRYLLAAFPVLAIVGARLSIAAPRARWVYAVTSSTGLALGASLFATGHLMT
jgi:hypothetical protein